MDSSDWTPGTYTVTATATSGEFEGSDTVTFTVTAQPSLVEVGLSDDTHRASQDQTLGQFPDGTIGNTAVASGDQCPRLGFRMKASRPIHRIGPMALDFRVAEEGCMQPGAGNGGPIDLEDVTVKSTPLPVGVDFVPTADGCVETEVGEIFCDIGRVPAGMSERAEAFICIGEDSSSFSLTATADASNADPVSARIHLPDGTLIFEDGFESGNTEEWSATTQ